MSAALAARGMELRRDRGATWLRIVRDDAPDGFQQGMAIADRRWPRVPGGLRPGVWVASGRFWRGPGLLGRG
eukprot:6442268-Alexandrium_andersonii.AAC.1